MSKKKTAVVKPAVEPASKTPAELVHLGSKIEVTVGLVRDGNCQVLDPLVLTVSHFSAEGYQSLFNTAQAKFAETLAELNA